MRYIGHAGSQTKATTLNRGESSHSYVHQHTVGDTKTPQFTFRSIMERVKASVEICGERELSSRGELPIPYQLPISYPQRFSKTVQFERPISCHKQ